MAEFPPSTSSTYNVKTEENSSSDPDINNFDMEDSNSSSSKSSTTESEYTYTRSCQQKLDEVLNYFKDFSTYLLVHKSEITKSTNDMDRLKKAVFFVGVKQLSKNIINNIATKKGLSEWIEYIEVGEKINIGYAMYQKTCLIEAIGVENLENVRSGKPYKGAKRQKTEEFGRALLKQAFSKNDYGSFDDQNVLETLEELEKNCIKFYAYLLLDTRKIAKVIDSISECVKAVIYVGKGGDRRVNDHTDDVQKIVNNPEDWIKHNNKIAAKHQKIIEIWRDEKPVRLLKVNADVSWDEASTLEAFLIEAIGLEKLTNYNNNNYPHYPKASPDAEEKNRMPYKARRKVGIALLNEAMKCYANSEYEDVYYKSTAAAAADDDDDDDDDDDIFDERSPIELEYNGSYKDKYDEFEVILKKRLTYFDMYPKNIPEDFFVFVMLDAIAIRDVADLAKAVSYVFVDKRDLQIFKQRLQEARETYGNGSSNKHVSRIHEIWKKGGFLLVRMVTSKLQFAEALYRESLYAYVLGREKANNLLIDISRMMAKEDLRKAGIQMLEHVKNTILMEQGAYVFGNEYFGCGFQ